MEAVGPPVAWGPPPAARPGSPSPRRVVATARRYGDAVVLLHAGGSELATTAAHPFWSADRREWVPAGELLEGERLLAADGTPVPLEGPPEVRRGGRALYNVEVEGDHTYYVGEAGLLAHNGVPCKVSADGRWRDIIGRYTKKPTINPGQQGKHIFGHNNFIPNRSRFTHPDPQKLVDRFAGKGQQVSPIYPRGQSGFKERVDFGEIIGQVLGLPTSKGLIVYGKKGVHIIPGNP